MDFLNIYDDNGIDMIIRTSVIKKIERGPREGERGNLSVDQYIRVEVETSTPIILYYDDEDSCDNAFEDFCDHLCEGD